MTAFVEHEVAVAQVAYREQHGDRSEWTPYEHEAFERLTARVAAEAETQERPEMAEGVARR